MASILIGLLALFLILLVATFVGVNTYLNTRPYRGPMAERDASTGEYLVTPLHNFHKPPTSVPMFNFVPEKPQVKMFNFWFGK